MTLNELIEIERAMVKFRDAVGRLVRAFNSFLFVFGEFDWWPVGAAA